MSAQPKLIVALLLAMVSSAAAQEQKPREIKVVVVTLFERGDDTGDQPGEFQNWVEREKLDEVIPFPAGWRNLRANRDGLLAICTGVGTAKAAASISALGLDPRFDLSRAYWLIAGIAGGDPADVTLGSVAWADYVVDGDLGHEIDSREIPADWPTGFIPLRRKKPYEPPRRSELEGEMYKLNSRLVDWAFSLTKDVALTDNDRLNERRSRYTEHPKAQGRAKVVRGDTLSASTFWHGKLLNEWANEWVRYHTMGEGNYVTTAMEDTGVLQALTFLSKAGKADLNRVLVLRAVSNFDMQPPGVTAAESLAGEKIGNYAAFFESLDNLHKAGGVVVKELVKNWKDYRSRIPDGGAPAAVH